MQNRSRHFAVLAFVLLLINLASTKPVNLGAFTGQGDEESTALEKRAAASVAALMLFILYIVDWLRKKQTDPSVYELPSLGSPEPFFAKVHIPHSNIVGSSSSRSRPNARSRAGTSSGASSSRTSLDFEINTVQLQGCLLDKLGVKYSDIEQIVNSLSRDPTALEVLVRRAQSGDSITNEMAQEAMGDDYAAKEQRLAENRAVENAFRECIAKQLGETIAVDLFPKTFYHPPHIPRT